MNISFPSDIDFLKNQADLFHKLNNSNDFTFSFALMELSEFTYEHGFEKAFELVKPMQNRLHQQRALGMLYEYARNHCTRWESSYDDLIVYMLQGWVR